MLPPASSPTSPSAGVPELRESISTSLAGAPMFALAFRSTLFAKTFGESLVVPEPERPSMIEPFVVTSDASRFVVTVFSGMSAMRSVTKMPSDEAVAVAVSRPVWSPRTSTLISRKFDDVPMLPAFAVMVMFLPMTSAKPPRA
jgi:hypothetical protein